MFVRSQNRRTLINLEYSSLYINRNNLIFATQFGEPIHIGTYSTEEKALKVLDMIVKRTQSCTKLIKTIRPATLHAFEPYESISEVVIQMPQDDEVKV